MAINQLTAITHHNMLAIMLSEEEISIVTVKTQPTRNHTTIWWIGSAQLHDKVSFLLYKELQGSIHDVAVTITLGLRIWMVYLHLGYVLHNWPTTLLLSCQFCLRNYIFFLRINIHLYPELLWMIYFSLTLPALQDPQKVSTIHIFGTQDPHLCKIHKNVRKIHDRYARSTSVYARSTSEIRMINQKVRKIRIIVDLAYLFVDVAYLRTVLFLSGVQLEVSN